MIKDLFKRERTFSTAILMSVLNVRSSCLFKGMLKTQFGLKTVLGLICLRESLVSIVWMLSCASGAIEWGVCIAKVGEGKGERRAECPWVCVSIVSQEVGVVKEQTVRSMLTDKSRDPSWFGWRPSCLKMLRIVDKRDTFCQAVPLQP